MAHPASAKGRPERFCAVCKRSLQLRKCFGGMTATAVHTESRCMNVVPAVTAAAGRRERHVVQIFGWAIVAGETVEAFVRSVEHEVRLGVVVELPDTPVIGVVANRAVRSEMQHVHVVLAVTVDALIIGVEETRVGVTALARHCGMQSDQRERGQIVIETDRLVPADLAVTVLAVFAKPALMNVVAPVTAVALGFW